MDYRSLFLVTRANGSKSSNWLAVTSALVLTAALRGCDWLSTEHCHRSQSESSLPSSTSRPRIDFAASQASCLRRSDPCGVGCFVGRSAGATKYWMNLSMLDK